jgi:hypothetical protein
MKKARSTTSWSLTLLVVALFAYASVPRTTMAQAKKPNIVVIMGDDIGMWNIGAYHPA